LHNWRKTQKLSPEINWAFVTLVLLVHHRQLLLASSLGQIDFQIIDDFRRQNIGEVDRLSA